MGYGKWIGGIVGFMAMGPLGGLAGFAIGSLFDSASSLEQRKEETTADACAGQRNSFLFSLLVIEHIPLSPPQPIFVAGDGFLYYPCRRKDHAQ